MEYSAAVATETSAAAASDVANLAVEARAAVGMMLAAGKVAMLAGRVDCTGATASAAEAGWGGRIPVWVGGGNSSSVSSINSSECDGGDGWG
jgi:hypothetical protein